MIPVSLLTLKTTKGSRPLRGLLALPIHAHPALETKPGFMLILRLENATHCVTRFASHSMVFPPAGFSTVNLISFPLTLPL